VEDLERLITLVTAQYRWGLHPLKVTAALLLPVLLLWAADWRVRRLAGDTEDRGSPRELAADRAPATGGD
jgi:hypothetical protein